MGTATRTTADPEGHGTGGSSMPQAVERARPRPLVSVVIPTFNEALNLPWVIPHVPDAYEVIIVDGGSTDGTTETAARLRPSARILQQPGRGKGDALACGFRAARGEIIVTLDADGSARTGELARFVAALDDADFAKGSRFLGGGGSADLTRTRKLGNLFLGKTVNLLFGTAFTDLCYGYNAFRAHCLWAVEPDCDGFEVETQMTIRAATAGLRIVEVPSYEDLRNHGVSNLRTFRDGTRVLRTIIAERFRRRRTSGAPASEQFRAPRAEPAEV